MSFSAVILGGETLLLTPATAPTAGQELRVASIADGLATLEWFTAAAPLDDHGGLSGLADDDHPQYAKKAGDTFTGVINGTSVVMSGNGSFGTLSVSGTSSFANVGLGGSNSIIWTGIGRLNGSAANNFRFLGADGVVPAGLTIGSLTASGPLHAPDASGTNASAAVDTVIASPRNTGNAAPARTVFKGTKTGASGATAQEQFDVATLNSTATTSWVDIISPSNTAYGMRLFCNTLGGGYIAGIGDDGTAGSSPGGARIEFSNNVLMRRANLCSIQIGAGLGGASGGPTITSNAGTPDISFGSGNPNTSTRLARLQVRSSEFTLVGADNMTPAAFVAGAITAGAGLTPGPSTFAGLPPAAAHQGAMRRLIDRDQKIVQSDGTDWRFISNDTIAS